MRTTGTMLECDHVSTLLIPCVSDIVNCSCLGTLMLQVDVMTELINGSFIQDFGTLLGSATGDGKTRKSFYEIDKEFKLMT